MQLLSPRQMITLILLIVALVVICVLTYFLITSHGCSSCPNGKSSNVLNANIPNREETLDTLTTAALNATQRTLQESGPPKTNNILSGARVDDVMVISLDGSPRWNDITVNNLQNAGFNKNEYRRWKAVNGSLLSNDDLNLLLTPNRQYITTCSEAQRRGKIDASQFSLGAVGCALSHWAAWYHVANDPNVRAALVLEDDAVFTERNAPERIATLVSEAGGVDKFDFLRLDPYPSDKQHGMCFENASFSQNLIRELGLTYNFTGYIVTKQGARKLLHRALPICEHIDHHPSYLAKLYPEWFFALQTGRNYSFLRQNRQIPSTIRV